jgi:putative ABC transport system permease protein
MLPLSYVLRSLWARRLNTALTVLSMALVVWVFATMMMMSEGIRATFVATGSPNNLIALRKGAGAEINSLISRQQAGVIASLPAIARDARGRSLVASETLVLNSLPKRDQAGSGNLAMRGTGDLGFALRPGLRLVEGRMFRPGTTELIAGVGAARGFAKVEVGNQLRFAGRDWPVVGRFDGRGSGFDSELWGDGEQMMQAFRRSAFSTVVLALRDPAGVEAVRAGIEADPRLGVEVKPEQAFYAEQSEQFAGMIRTLGVALSLCFAVGAVAGAMITMLAAVASRTAEIGTLRALGFRRNAVLTAFLAESLALSLLGGVLGVACAALTSQMEVTTTNAQTFSEVAFRFDLTPDIALAALAFSLLMGLLGGFLPALRAARLNIVDALRAT